MNGLECTCSKYFTIFNAVLEVGVYSLILKIEID